MSGGSVSSMTTSNSFSAYAPNPQPKRQASEASDYGDYQQRYGYSDPDKTATYDNHVQEITLAAPPVYGAYAPSPTLLGANDPLGRTSARAPVISFGAGGRFVTCLHGSGTLNTGFDVALATRQSTDVRIQKLHDVIPQSALDTTEVVFPGPLFNDPGTPTTSLVGTGAAAKTKAKKAKVLQYLEDRANELDRGLGYLSTDSIEHSHAEGKLALVRLLKVMVENDGKLTGSAAIDTAVRAALVPRLANSTGDAADSLHTPALGYAGIPSLHSNEAPLATYQVRASSLDKIQDFLIRGERKKACHYAADEKLWAHAMVIASSVDKDTWKEVVNDFVRSELGVREEKSNGREALRVAYSLFAGQGAAAVEELLPPKLLTRTLGQTLTAGPLQVPPIAHGTPISPNFPHPEKTARVPAESLAKWPETAAMLASSPMTPDSAAALVALGDYLMSNDWIEAAHACYLLSSQAHLIGGSRAPSARIVLVGSQSPHLRLNFHKDSDPVIFSEIAEFAASLTPAPKGQEPFPGWAHLQPYKLVRAYHLAELGHTQAANRYCEAIRNSLTRPSPYLNMAFADELKALHDRLTAVPQLDKAGSWIGGKMAKPSLDSIGNWLEGRFTKFIAGEGENSPPPTDDVAVPGQTSSGPFAHYSAISSAAPSTSPSPQPSFTAYNGMPPPPRSGSAMSSRQSTVPQVQIDRASSAMDHYRRKGSPAPINRVYSANAATTTFAQAEAAGNGYAPGRSSLDESKDNGGWWNSSFTADSAAPTPTATTFGASPENASDEGFISLMDVPASPMPISSPGATRTNYPPEDPDDDDLGLGNASSKRKKNSTDDADADGTTPTATQKKAEPPKPKAEEKKAEPTATSNGWLSRWWKKSDGPAPVKANMGEDNSFYFDKELGKWVNKKAGGAEAAKPAAPPPPPSRAQTASPSKTASVMPHTGTVAGEPPVRATSSFDLTSPPRKPPPPRARSNLVPTENLPDSAPPSPAPGAGLNVPPPPSRPSSRAQAGGKKNLRSRYVDVFQAQPGGGAA
ncbi:hypothetical protein PUNSTDRAFT_105006 [Punctularia strigosozonata HHB-11173 SS5]|uniref:uncharacterized protein n=1 Tax=Punctularia strigosozonata (strain HHB-11173) TaxID=741275 RepID=UPI0004416269|nr:uncharacterized protein PUNSTDRAFT_105006 [Punctularia strigosozonata HHB-11173 SS5]EIN07345.1 hypothetical protein PUNSTDRAFT_105006 [Punctularia strigosozonata HHB-11173 SS5]